MTHSAKRIQKGKYHYRGYEIEDMTLWSDAPYTFWNIRELTEQSAHDCENTLAQCKALIDWWKDNNKAAA
jgi:hypothetical protein|tara:strand:+ start:2907 stop:3116 length:210 start_codon:yes stop_codon:yes gene_type:complete